MNSCLFVVPNFSYPSPHLCRLIPFQCDGIKQHSSHKLISGNTDTPRRKLSVSALPLCARDNTGAGLYMRRVSVTSVYT